MTDMKYAIIELMGRQQIAGALNEVTIAGAPFIEITVPATSERPEFTRLFSPAAIYSITPCSIQQAGAAAVEIGVQGPEVYDPKWVKAFKAGGVYKYLTGGFRGSPYVPDDTTPTVHDPLYMGRFIEDRPRRSGKSIINEPEEIDETDPDETMTDPEGEKVFDEFDGVANWGGMVGDDSETLEFDDSEADDSGDIIGHDGSHWSISE